MADLKSGQTPEEFLRDAAEAVVENSARRLEHEVAEALAQARQAALALAEMPKSSNDLLVAATLALSADFDVGDSVSWDTRFVNVGIGRGSVSLRDANYGSERHLPRGKYRALLFILPLKS
jgi:hypothetical protein